MIGLENRKTTAVRGCPECGATVFADAPEGVCSVCLFRAGLASHDDKDDEPDLLVGQTIGHYKISERIGTGGMGEVYLATDVTADRKAALKLLPTRFTGDAERLKRFQREARAVVRLNHPNILTIYEIGEDHSIHYIASELIEGETLRQGLTRGPTQLSEAVDVAIQVASALAAAHQAGIVHRDIKPENIMLRPDGYVKVLDFGIAKLAQQELPVTMPKDEALLLVETNLGSILGTARYMSPEQARGGQADKSTDIWSLGIVLYEMVTGHTPFTGDTPKEVMSAILEKEPKPLTSYIKQTPPELQQIISKTLRKDRARRYRSAHELLEALKDLRRKLEFESFFAAGFFEELKRRKVYRVAAAYIIVAAGMIQLASAGFPAWDLPNWALRLVIMLVLIGFPLALVFGWVFDLTSQGIRATPSARPGTHRRRSVIMLIATGVIISAAAGFFLLPRLSAYKIDKSIAVLPFDNLSGDPNNAYFAEGIQEEIMTHLAKVADLKVISRTSTQRYQSKPRNLAEIAKQLAVANILEGSVQKVADQVRVNVQLINAQSNSHLWAESYDRKLIDIFGVESEIAKGIADSLRAKLTGQEEQALALKPTNNLEAYDAYLRGMACIRDARCGALITQKYLKEAVRLDPKFALAWAMLSWFDAANYRKTSLPPTPALREEARQAAETALTLQPNLGEAILAKGFYHYACLRDYDTAMRYFEQARQLLPNSSLVLQSLAFLERRRGQWERSESYFNEAERLDPRNADLLATHALNYVLLRRFPEALRKFDQVLNITPEDVSALAYKASIAQAEGDLPRAAALLAPLHPSANNPEAFVTQVYQAILERRPASIIPRLKEILAGPDPAWGNDISGLRFLLAWTQDVAGDRAAALESWRQARSEQESSFKEQPENSQLIGDLALTNMGLRDKAAALALAEQAIAADPLEKDALLGAASIAILARVTAQMGEPDRAIAALEKLRSVPGHDRLISVPLTPALLRLDPMFDPLRNDPRFQKLCEEKQP